ncbi:hypothetical protein [Aquirufa lenticrescens]|uniref:hypothetical protein n=1 Tax=Aquirufa lenticrescens TaxID=2696560 RepID=UPI001CAA5674|nr:hypothetical protein [Aquirufa lenticrescens]UAJ14249.1 hypothetical protein G9X62_06600 [Aquirufa lenticrescens]
MFSLVAPSLSSLNRFSALIVQHGLAVQEGLVVQNCLAVHNGLVFYIALQFNGLVFYITLLFKMALIAQNRLMVK